MNNEVEVRRIRLVENLKELTKEEGVQRLNLIELLRGELSLLATTLRIDTAQGLDVVRRSVEASLYSLIVQVAPPKGRKPLTAEQRKKQYAFGLITSFNIQPSPELRSLKLQERRNWLDKPERGSARVSPSTSQRELNHGIQAIAGMLVSGDYHPPTPATSELRPVAYADVIEDDGSVRPQTVRQVRRKKFVIAGSLAGVMVLVLTLTTAPGTLRSLFEASSPADEAPYEVKVISNPDEFPLGRSTAMDYYFEKPISEIPAPPLDSTACTKKHKWAHENGGFDLGGSASQFSVYSRNKPIHILSARVEIVERLTPKAGVSISCGQGSPVESRHVYVKLGSQPEVIYKPDGYTDEPFVFEIKPGSIELFDVRSLNAMGGSSCSWRIVLNATVDGKSQEIIVDDNGKPFVMYVEPEGTKRHQWHDGKWKTQQ